MKIFYIVHDINDPTVTRRIVQLQRGKAEVCLAGFRRGSLPVAPLGSVITDFGRTIDGRLAQRAASIVKASLRVSAWKRASQGCDIIIARGLEMLVLGSLLRFVSTGRRPLVYECLDIHRLMVSRSLVGHMLRLLERRLIRHCSLIVTSSPAFVEEYFLPTHKRLPSVLLWENKLLADEINLDRVSPYRSEGPPWRIGWFGVIRCARSLELLQGLCESQPGRVEVEIRGRPTKELLPKLERAIASTAGLNFLGPYDRSRDLSSIYGGVHFTWTVDFFEEGANSAWLLPNRLYEGPAHASIPIALEWVETGRWLALHMCGVLLKTDVGSDLSKFFQSVSEDTYRSLSRNLELVDQGAFYQSNYELSCIVQQLAGLK